MAIIEFYGRECPHCHKMRPLLDKLEKAGYEIEHYEIWHSPENRRDKYVPMEKGRCGGVPFYVNPKTDEWICGETTFGELKALADGKKINHGDEEEYWPFGDFEKK
jgi:thiol-disulfide isomerase/thioredoxin